VANKGRAAAFPCCVGPTASGYVNVCIEANRRAPDVYHQLLGPLIGVNGRATMHSEMLDLQTSQQVGWNISIFLRALLLCLLIFHRNIGSFPYFTAYLVANLTKAVILLVAYRAWGIDSWPTYFVAWGSEAGVACLRALAVAELCRRMLGHYRGIWSLAWRVLLSGAVLVVTYSAIDAARAPQHSLAQGAIAANRALELAVTVVMVVLFIFLRHYQVNSDPAVRSLALGFCVYSCVSVVNFTILDRFAIEYVQVWNFLGVFTYLVCLTMWAWALRKAIPVPRFGSPSLFAGAVYQRISPEVNARLRMINEQLSQFWRTQEPQR